MATNYSYEGSLHPNWGFPKEPLRDAGETITAHDLQKILYDELSFERSLDEVPMFLCERFCAWPDQGGVPKDILILRFNEREQAYNKKRDYGRDLYDILKYLCLKIYSKLKRLLPLEEENEYITLAFHDGLFIKGGPFRQKRPPRR
tara:strand:+ start:168 stop:605 length:438 start_codon:yes stop_codon:yes gene_type:complete